MNFKDVERDVVMERVYDLLEKRENERERPTDSSTESDTELPVVKPEPVDPTQQDPRREEEVFYSRFFK